MNLKHLKYFYWVSKFGSFSQAANQLDISEPSVNRAVRSLERFCGVQLFYREKGRLKPTHAGQLLYDSAERIHALEKATEDSIAELISPRKGLIAFGATHPLGYSMIQWLRSWRLDNPRARLAIAIGLRNELYARVLAGELAFAVAPIMGLPPGLQADPRIFHDDLLFVARAKHPLSKRRAVSQAELILEQFETTFPATVTHSLLTEMLGASHNGIAIQVDDAGIAMGLITAGAGIGLVSRRMAKREMEQGNLSILHVEGFPYSAPNGFVYRSGVSLSHESASLISYLSSCFAD